MNDSNGESINVPNMATATPDDCSLMEEMEVTMMASFNNIGAARKLELDSLCEAQWTESEAKENEELWAAAFQKQAVGLSLEERNALWHRIMTSAFENDAGAMGNWKTPVAPVGEQEERYVQWRRTFNQRCNTERLALAAVEARRIAGKLAGKVAEDSKTISELTIKFSVIMARLSRSMTPKEFQLFMLLCSAESNDNTVLTYAEIGRKFNGISRQAVSTQVQKLKRNFPDAWRLVKACRQSGRPCTYNDSIASANWRSNEDNVMQAEEDDSD